MKTGALQDFRVCDSKTGWLLMIEGLILINEMKDTRGKALQVVRCENSSRDFVHSKEKFLRSISRKATSTNNYKRLGSILRSLLDEIASANNTIKTGICDKNEGFKIINTCQNGFAVNAKDGNYYNKLGSILPCLLEAQTPLFNPIQSICCAEGRVL